MTVSKPYYTLGEYLRERFGKKVWKVTVDAGFTCPNRDGAKGFGGCVYCNNDSFANVSAGSIAEQVKAGISRLRKKRIDAFIIYFQAYSNTYGSLGEIREKIEGSLVDEGIVSLHIGTRPDTVDAAKLDWLAEINKKYEVVMEYGLQSSNPAALELINRGHTAEDFSEAVRLTHERGLKVCAHIILGLPGDSLEDMKNTVRFVSSLRVHSVKFHHLHIVKNTVLAEMYENGEALVMTPEEYADILAECISLLPEKTVIARIMGDASGDTLIAPKWNISKSGFSALLEKTMRDRGLVQGQGI
jgi:radical SAM protein (TIGR01212 family)